MAKKVDDKRFSRQEVELIVRRAAELQRRPSDDRIAAGASLAEVEALAGQLGIERSHVRAAALELHRPKAGGLAVRLLGAPTRLRLSRTLPRAITSDAFERLLLIIQEAEESGNVAVVGNTLTWSSGQRPVRRTIVVSSHEDGTTLTLDIQARPLAGGLFAGFGGGFGIAAGANAAAAAVAQHSLALGALTAAIGATAYLVPRFVFRRRIAGEIRRGEALLDRLVAELER